MSYVILDLEWNGSYSKRRKKFINEIIEFGAVKVDENLNVIATFSMLVTPQIGKKLTSRVTQLTHITDQLLIDSNKTFTHVLKKFISFLGDSVLLTWGKSDIITLMENCEYYFHNDNLDFLKAYCDLQIFCQNKLGVGSKGQSLGLLNCAELLSIDAEQQQLHRAQADALLSLKCFEKLYDKELLQKLTILSENGEFRRWIKFKPTYIYDINNPLVNKSKMFFDCEICAKRLTQKTDWVVKNRTFRAIFICEHCQKEFLGKISFKLRYEGVTMSKKIVPLIKKESDQAEKSEIDVSH